MSKNVCKSCNSTVLPTAKICPVCNKKLKSGILGLLVKSILYFFTALVALAILSAIFSRGDNSNVSRITTLKPTETEYQNSIGLDYRAALLKDIPEKTLLKFKGKVVQISEERYVRLATKQVFGSYIEDDVILVFSDKPRVIEGDIVEVKTRYNGTLTYETVLGSSRTVPRFIVDYYKVTKER